jgi:hypothetical protein
VQGRGNFDVFDELFAVDFGDRTTCRMFRNVPAVPAARKNRLTGRKSRQERESHSH